MESLRASSVAATVAFTLSVLATGVATAKRAPAPPAETAPAASSTAPPSASAGASTSTAAALVAPAPTATATATVSAGSGSSDSAPSPSASPAGPTEVAADEPVEEAAPKQPPPRSYGTPGDGADIPIQATRRRGFIVGFVGGLALGSSAGTPPEFDKRNDTYHVSTGLRPGGSGALFLGGALTDWFTFSVGLGRTSFSKSDLTFSSTTLLFRAEAYPFFGLGGPFRDLGVGLDLGTGSSRIDRGDEVQAAAGGGSTSVFGGGVFYELVRGHGFSLSPYAGITHLVSETLTTNTGLLGLRVAYTTGP